VGVRSLGSLALVVLAPASALGQERTWEWQWGMHPMMFMCGSGHRVVDRRLANLRAALADARGLRYSPRR
jgi:hypothetical protein